MNYDGPSGGGWQASDELFGFYNDYTVTEDEQHANYSNRLYTKVQLKGLLLPYEIGFGDSLEGVFEIIGIELNPFNDFWADKNSNTTMTLYSADNATLVFQNLTLTEEPVEYELPYMLIYSEIYEIQQDTGKPIVVERKITLSFGLQNATLSRFDVSVNELRVIE